MRKLKLIIITLLLSNVCYSQYLGVAVIIDNNILSSQGSIGYEKSFTDIGLGRFSTKPIPEVILGIETGIYSSIIEQSTETQRQLYEFQNINIFGRLYGELKFVSDIPLYLRAEWSPKSSGVGVLMWKKRLENIEANIGYVYDTKDRNRFEVGIKFLL